MSSRLEYSSAVGKGQRSWQSEYPAVIREAQLQEIRETSAATAFGIPCTARARHTSTWLTGSQRLESNYCEVTSAQVYVLSFAHVSKQLTGMFRSFSVALLLCCRAPPALVDTNERRAFQHVHLKCNKQYLIDRNWEHAVVLFAWVHPKPMPYALFCHRNSELSSSMTLCTDTRKFSKSWV